MRTLFLVAYDVRDPKRLRAVFKIMRGHGDHLQYSVFRCELSERERAELMTKLGEKIKPSEDQVLLVPLGPAGGQREVQIYALGQPYVASVHEAVVI